MIWLLVLLMWFGVGEVKAYELPVSAISGFEKVIDRGSNPDKTYNYAPSIMLDDGGVYRMWWCGNFRPMTTPNDDKILYSTSADGVNWAPAIKVLDSQRRPNQGRCACDPTVVRADNGEYYVFYTTDNPEKMDGMWGNQVFLAWSAGTGDPARISYAFSGKPVIPLPPYFEPGTKLYGYGQSSVLWKDGGFQMIYSDFTVQNVGKVKASFSSDGGRNFNLTKDDLAIGAMSVDVKWMPRRQMYVAVAETPQWHIAMFLLDKNLNVLQKITFPVGENSIENGRRSNHNPGLLGDKYGNVVNEEKPMIYFASSGEVTELPSPSGPYNWKIYKAQIDLTGVLESMGLGGCRVQGYKVGADGGACNGTNCPSEAEVILNSGRTRVTTNPYVVEVMAGQQEVKLTVPNGYTVEYSYCKGCMSHSETSWKKGNAASIDCETGSYADLWWRLKKEAKGDANADGKINIADFAIWKTEYLTKNGTKSDFDKNGKVTIADFAIWKTEYLRLK